MQRDVVDIADALPLTLPRGLTPGQTALAALVVACGLYTSVALIYTTACLLQWVLA